MTRHRTTSHSAKSRSLPGVSFIAVSPLVAPKRSFGTLPHRQEGLNAQANVGRQEVDRSHRTKMTNGTARVSGAWFEPKGTCNRSRGPLGQLGGPAPLSLGGRKGRSPTRIGGNPRCLRGRAVPAEPLANSPNSRARPRTREGHPSYTARRPAHNSERSMQERSESR